MVEEFKKEECIVNGISYNKPGECGTAQQNLRNEQQTAMRGGKRRSMKNRRNRNKRSNKRRNKRKTNKRQRGGRRNRRTRRLRNRKNRKNRRSCKKQRGGSGNKESVSYAAIKDGAGDKKGAETALKMENLSEQVKYNNSKTDN